MSGKLSLICLCALLVAVHCRSLRERRSPDSSEEQSWSDALKNTFEKAKDKVTGAIDDVRKSDTYATVKQGVSDAGDKIKEGVSTAGDKLSEFGQNIKNSSPYEKVSSELSKVRDNIKESDTYQEVTSSLSKAAENVKEKLDD